MGFVIGVGSKMVRGGGSRIRGSGSGGEGRMVSESLSQGSVIYSDPAEDPYQEPESDEDFEEDGELHEEVGGQGSSMLGNTAGRQPSKMDPKISGITGK